MLATAFGTSVEAGGVVRRVAQAASAALDPGYGNGRSRAGSRDPATGYDSVAAEYQLPPVVVHQVAGQHVHRLPVVIQLVLVTGLAPPARKEDVPQPVDDVHLKSGGVGPRAVAQGEQVMVDARDQELEGLGQPAPDGLQFPQVPGSVVRGLCLLGGVLLGFIHCFLLGCFLLGCTGLVSVAWGPDHEWGRSWVSQSGPARVPRPCPQACGAPRHLPAAPGVSLGWLKPREKKGLNQRE